MSEEERKIKERISRSDFLSQMIIMGYAESSEVQQEFLDDLTKLAIDLRKIFSNSGVIESIEYTPSIFWNSCKGKCIGFVDGGVANIDIPTSTPLGIRVGSYVVRPGDDSNDREEFSIEFELVDELFSLKSKTYEDIFDDQSKLQDAARMTLEVSAVRKLLNRVKDISAVLLHGPLINPVSPYGLKGFPAFKPDLASQLTGEEIQEGDNSHFVAVYLQILDFLKEKEIPVLGVIERNNTKSCRFVANILASLEKKKQLSTKIYRSLQDRLEEEITLNDSMILDIILEPGEFVSPLSVNRQGTENHWPNDWKSHIRRYPLANTTYIKPSENSEPFRIESFDNLSDYQEWYSLIFYTSRLLPNYGFPVGLDIVDKYAKVPHGCLSR